MHRNIETKVIKYFFIAALFITCIMIRPALCSADEVTGNVEGIEDLDAGKTYNYDLNNDGIIDNIYYESTCDEKSYSTVVKLYINDSLAYIRKDINCFIYQLQLCDLDKGDNKLDLYLFCRMDSDGIKYSSFISYDGKGITLNKSFNPKKISKYYDIYRYSIANVKGDGTFDAVLDTPIYSNTIGCYNCYVPFQLKDNVISNEATYIYSLTNGSKDYKYKALKNFNTYVKAGSKTVSFKVVKGAKVTFDKVYITAKGNLYARVINSKGQKGWINAQQKDLFAEIPQWG